MLLRNIKVRLPFTPPLATSFFAPALGFRQMSARTFASRPALTQRGRLSSAPPGAQHGTARGSGGRETRRPGGSAGGGAGEPGGRHGKPGGGSEQRRRQQGSASAAAGHRRLPQLGPPATFPRPSGAAAVTALTRAGEMLAPRAAVHRCGPAPG